jgi:hypothetical protein
LQIPILEHNLNGKNIFIGWLTCGTMELRELGEILSIYKSNKIDMNNIYKIREFQR